MTLSARLIPSPVYDLFLVAGVNAEPFTPEDYNRPVPVLWDLVAWEFGGDALWVVCCDSNGYCYVDSSLLFAEYQRSPDPAFDDDDGDPAHPSAALDTGADNSSDDAFVFDPESEPIDDGFDDGDDGTIEFSEPHVDDLLLALFGPPRP